MSTLVSLESENVKRIIAVRVEPDPTSGVVIIGGMNEQGKTSFLDSLAMLLGGADEIPLKPIRTGATKAKITGKTSDDFILERKFTASGSTLKVTAADGAPVASPQALLDRLVSKRTFDPLSFTKLDAKKQLEALRQLLGLDFTDLDKEHAGKYGTRTETNRKLKEQEAKCNKLQRYPEAPAEEVSIAELTAKLTAANTTNAEHNTARGNLTTLLDVIDDRRESVERAHGEVNRIQAELTRAQQTLEEARERLTKATGEHADLAASIEKLEDVDTSAITQQMAELEETNRKVRDNITWKKEQAELVRLQGESNALTKRLTEIEEEKRKQIAKAKSPVPGLSFEGDSLFLNGEPFEQASSAQKLRVSVAMGFALQPGLKVALIRDGSLLDGKSLEIVAKTAEEHGGQVWIERVGEGAECSIIIEAGEVKEDRTKAKKGTK